MKKNKYNVCVNKNQIKFTLKFKLQKKNLKQQL